MAENIPSSYPSIVSVFSHPTITLCALVSGLLTYWKAEKQIVWTAISLCHYWCTCWPGCPAMLLLTSYKVISLSIWTCPISIIAFLYLVLCLCLVVTV